MLSVITNRYFIICTFLICLQQIFVGMSTYFIGLAGGEVASDPALAFYYTVFFFSSIFVAYLLGASSLFFRVKLSNYLWGRYYKKTLMEISSDYRLATSENKKSTQSWLSGEALSTLDEAGFSIVEMLAIYFNVLFTTVALFLVLGYELSGVIVFCMIMSVFFLYLAKKKIEIFARSMQNDKLFSLVSIGNVWDNVFFGSKKLSKKAILLSNDATKIFFKKTEKYKILEQIISCAPILISIPILVFFSYHQYINKSLAMGAMVAVLPRTLQLFQNIHAGNMITSQIFLLRNKIINLNKFPSQLDAFDLLSEIRFDHIVIYSFNARSVINPSDFTNTSFTSKGLVGRYLISGSNGSGKSSILKYIKSRHDDALLIGPGISLGNDLSLGSTGQNQMHQIESSLNSDSFIILLDEWDSNLDEYNVNKVNSMISEASKSKVIIEVRHKKTS